MIKKKIEKNSAQNPLKKRVDELENQLKRALADYHNLSRRIEEKQSEWRKKATARIVDKLLDVYGDLCRAEGHLKERGLTMAVNQFWSVLESEGVEEIKTDGCDFDPELMDCCEIVTGPGNKVVATLSKGYKLNHQVIRPAKVRVGKGGDK